jgi:hypothetical protein
VSITADVVWAFANVYSFIYLKRVGDSARGGEAGRVSVVPFVAANGCAGASIRFRF